MSTRHSREKLLVAAVASLVTLLACRQSGRTHGLDTLVVAIESSPLHLDPRIGIDQNSWRVHHVVFNGLMKNGAIGDYVPDLAASVSSEDGAVWKVRLRPGVTFHDGRPLTSRDVVYTYQSLLAPSFLSSKKEPLRIIRSIEAPGPYDVVFRLERPYASFPLQLLFGIVPEGTSAEEGDRNPVGTGPYRFVSYRTDDRVVFERFDGYFGEKARLARLVYKIVPDATTRALELRRGSLDLVHNSLPPDMVPALAKVPSLAVTEGPGATYFYVAFNLRDPLVGRKEVRRALALALDRDALARGLWRGTVEKTETILPPGHWARADDLPPLERNLAEARRLLDAAGFPDPGGGRPRLTVTYKTSTDEMSLLQATAIAAQWKEAGVETKIRSNDFAVFFQDIVKGSFQIYSLRWQGIVDPDHYHEIFLSTAFPPKGWNRGFFADPDVDRWIEEGRTLLPREARKPVYAAIQRRVAEELPYLSLFVTRNVAVHAKELTGVDQMPQTGDFTFLPGVSRR